MAKWVFSQKSGPQADRKKLELDGYNAPFGRPRVGPVVREEITSRIQTTYYPGSDKPTRHAFGANWGTTEFHGRWMTKTQRDGRTANDVATDWTEFVKDERDCNIAWGNIVSYVGYVSKLILERESEHEIAWRMTVELDSRDDVVTKKTPIAVKPVADIEADFQNFLATSKKNLADVEDTLSLDFFDSLDLLAGQLNAPSAALNKLVSKFASLEEASYNTLQHFRESIVGITKAVVALRDVVINTAIDDAMLVRTAENDIAWVKYQTNLDNQTYLILDELGILDRQAELAMKNDPTKFVTAINGDTWESISIRASGGIDKVSQIRQMNGIRYGERPTPGEAYIVP